MDNARKIENILTDCGLKLLDTPTRRNAEETEFFAFVEVGRNKKGNQVPSNSKLNKIANDLASIGIEINFILSDTSSHDIEAGLRATLRFSFPDDVRNAFLTIEGIRAIVWIDPKYSSTRNLIDRLRERSEVYLTNTGLCLDEVRFTVEESLPSRTAILRTLRVIAPASNDDLKKKLVTSGFTEPPKGYLARHLDNLRKGGFVVRRKDERYALTSVALKSLGTKKKRNSPDIVRLLDLARREE